MAASKPVEGAPVAAATGGGANPADGETFLLAAMYAAQGYAVVATDYLGFAKSTYTYHPYLHADSEASAMLDSIRAARAAANLQGTALSGKVMLTGYSQGGHSSMAAHRAIERDNAGEINVVAGAHLAGPYNLSGSLKLSNAIAGYQFFVPYLVTAWQKIYGNVYSNVTQAFKLPYSNYIETLLPSPTLTYTTLVTTGQLPGTAPDVARDAIFQPAFLADVQSNPNNGLIVDAKKNDLLGWNPKSRTLLCGGAGDPTVPPAVHMAVAQADILQPRPDECHIGRCRPVDPRRLRHQRRGPDRSRERGFRELLRQLPRQL